MRSGRSPLLLLLLGVAFALWRPLLCMPDLADRGCSTFPNYSERCRLPKERFFYNVASKSCKRFLYFGCPSNKNTYSDLKECQQFCSENDVCQLPPEKAPCRNKWQRWFYDPKTELCKSYSSTECGSNLNNFDTYSACRLRCHKRDVCQLPPDPRPCDVKRHHWFYDPKTQVCKRFPFGECGGNSNNFNTFSDCRLACHNTGSP